MEPNLTLLAFVAIFLGIPVLAMVLVLAKLIWKVTGYKSKNQGISRKRAFFELLGNACYFATFYFSLLNILIVANYFIGYGYVTLINAAMAAIGIALRPRFYFDLYLTKDKTFFNKHFKPTTTNRIASIIFIFVSIAALLAGRFFS